MTSTTGRNGRLGNQIIRNLAVSLLAKKHNLKVEYYNKDLIKKLGIELFTGSNSYNYINYLTDDNYIPAIDAIVSELEIDEAEYHINLRKDADKANQFISGYSTDPEWNPNFDPKRQEEIEKIISEK